MQLNAKCKARVLLTPETVGRLAPDQHSSRLAYRPQPLLPDRSMHEMDQTYLCLHDPLHVG